MPRQCDLDGCSRPHYAAGYCNPHWRRWKRSGDPGSVEVNSPTPGQCGFPECDRPKSCKGLCATHYAQKQRGLSLAPISRQGRQPLRDLILMRVYGINRARFDEMLAAQNNGCAVCGGVNASGRDFHVDHDHSCCEGTKSCGKCVRGLLCSRCNTGLGMFKDSPELLGAAARYIRGD